MIQVQVLRAWPRKHLAQTLDLPDGATVAEALAACGLPQEGVQGYAVFGETADAATKLRNGDRLELLSPLRIDPKEARRRRAAGRG